MKRGKKKKKWEKIKWAVAAAGDAHVRDAITVLVGEVMYDFLGAGDEGGLQRQQGQGHNDDWERAHARSAGQASQFPQ